MSARPVAIVTGASAGIGVAFARRLAPTHDLVLVARRKERLEALAAELAGAGRAHRALALDLGSPEAVDALVREVPSCELLVNNAGIGGVGDAHARDPARQAAMVDLNCRAVVLLTRAYLPGMVERRRGGVLNVASYGAWLTTPGMAVYTASKSFVVAYSEAVRAEVKGTGVKVSCLCPGPTESEFMEQAGMQLGDKLAPLKSLAFQSADAVAKAGLRALAKNRAVHVPGVNNRLTLWLAALSPRALGLWIAGRLVR